MAGKGSVLGGLGGGAAKGAVRRTDARRIRVRKGTGAALRSVGGWWVRAVSYFGECLVAR